MGYHLAIFDLDGTILDTLDDLKTSLNFALRQSSLPERSREEVRHFVGNGIRKLIERSVQPNTSPEQTDQVFEDFSRHYKLHCADQTRAYRGIPEMLAALKNTGLKTAVISNKADYAVQDLCRHYFAGQFDWVTGEKPGIRKKPMPDSVYMVLEQLKTDRKDAIYIGDSEVDIQTAGNVGIDSILVSWGFREKDFLYQCGAERVIDDPQELFSIIFPASTSECPKSR
ncbi:MAG: HAD-IA family hydrolase [Clostridiales bacterium]|nr:HAD-IA family hydrolase [Clostridiales bacterium]